mgnify:CR=1 FL=1
MEDDNFFTEEVLEVFANCQFDLNSETDKKEEKNKKIKNLSDQEKTILDRYNTIKNNLIKNLNS